MSLVYKFLLTAVLILSVFAGNTSLFAQNPNLKKVNELDSLTEAAYNSGNFELSIQRANDALQYAEKNLGPDDTTTIKIRSTYGYVLMQAGHLNASEKVLKSGLGLIEKKYPNSTAHIDILGNLAMSYYYSGKFEAAENCYITQLALFEKSNMKQSALYAQAVNNLGALYVETRRYEEAEPLYLLSKNLRKEILGEKHSAYGQSLNNLAVLYKNLKRFEEAEAMHLENLKLQKNLSESSYARALNNFAIYYSVTGQEKKALPLLLESAAIRKKIFGSEHHDYANALTNLGRAYDHFEAYKTAEKYFLEAIKIREKVFQPQHPDLLESYNDIAYIYHDLGDSLKMFDYVQKSLQQNGMKLALPKEFNEDFVQMLEKTAFANNYQAIMSLNVLYRYVHKQCLKFPENQSLKTAALNICRVVLSLEDKYRMSFSAESDKLRSASELMKWNKNAVELSYDLSKKDKQHIEEAFLVAERNKSIILLNALKAQRARTFGDLPDSLVNKEQLLQKELSQVQKQLIETGDEQKKKELIEKQNRLSLASSTFKKSIEEKYPKYYKLKYTASNIDVSALQKNLPEKAMMLEYYLADSQVYIFSLSRTAINIHRETIDPQVLKSQIKKLRKSLSDYTYIKNETKAATADFKETAEWFYEKLLSKVLESAKNIDYLIIMPDGELGHLPFEVFLTEKTAGTDFSKMPYLLNKFKISYNYSAALWMENLSQAKKKNNAKVYAAAAIYSNNSDSLRAPKTRDGNLMKIRQGLQDLPEARMEVKGLEKLFQGKFMTAKAASEAAFKKEAGDYAVIHLAMHGLLNTQYPILSSLAFTENGDSTEDNFLQAYEVSNMNLNAQLVVLSACETGYGKFQQGEGVMSLARSFMYAGVPSLVVSLWQVNDASTSDIMQLFYKNLAKGMDKAEALRQAKLEYMKKSAANASLMAHPAFWAAFVQLGDSRPINIHQIMTFGSMLWISIAIGLAVILFIVGFVWRKR